MKKVVKFLSFAFLSSFLVAATALASNSSNTLTDVKASENALREQVANALSEVNFENGNEVYVYFTVSPSKGFEVNSVSGENAGLTREVKRTLSTKSIVAPANLEGKYFVKVKFTDISSL